MTMLVYMRQAQNNDLVDIVSIIEAARFYLKQQLLTVPGNRESVKSVRLFATPIRYKEL